MVAKGSVGPVGEDQGATEPSVRDMPFMASILAGSVAAALRAAALVLIGRGAAAIGSLLWRSAVPAALVIGGLLLVLGVGMALVASRRPAARPWGRRGGVYLDAKGLMTLVEAGRDTPAPPRFS